MGGGGTVLLCTLVDLHVHVHVQRHTCRPTCTETKVCSNNTSYVLLVTGACSAINPVSVIACRQASNFYVILHFTVTHTSGFASGSTWST